MKEAAERKARAWINAPFEDIQRDLDTIAALGELTTDELEQLSDIGKLIADEKRNAVPVAKKRGRPVGSKTAKKAEVSGGGE